MSAPMICPECDKGLLSVNPVAACPRCLGLGVRLCNECGSPATREPFPGQPLCEQCARKAAA